MNQDGPRNLLLRTPLAQTAALFLCYWLAWKAAAVFEVQPHVSALYLSAGLTTAVGMIGGWRHLPAAFLAICVVRQLDMPAPLLEGIDWGGALRQVLVYGGTGVLLRPRWLAMPARLTLADALHFVLLAFAATSVSAAATLFIPPFDRLPANELGAVFLSFWGGDFAGLLLGLPAIVLGWNALLRHDADQSQRNDNTTAPRHGLRSSSGLLGLALCVSALTLLLPQITHSEAKLGILVLFPVLLAGLMRGVLMGYLVAALVCAIQILAGRLLGLPVDGVLDLQLVLAMSAATALLAGAAHDDKHFEWQHANFDLLTGLANRRQFHATGEELFALAKRTRRPLTLLNLDIDDFKAVNDTFGHAGGDAVLVQVAQALKACCRESDLIARVGGDEFLLLLPDTAPGPTLEALLQRLRVAVGHVLPETPPPARPGVSIGVAACNQNTPTLSALMRQADETMYRAKATADAPTPA